MESVCYATYMVTIYDYTLIYNWSAVSTAEMSKVKTNKKQKQNKLGGGVGNNTILIQQNLLQLQRTISNSSKRISEFWTWSPYCLCIRNQLLYI